MADLSPEQYQVLSDRIKSEENMAKLFLEKARLNDRNIDKVEDCDETCRLKLGCMLDYAVNEFEMLCLDYDFNYFKSWYYFIGAL